MSHCVRDNPMPQFPRCTGNPEACDLCNIAAFVEATLERAVDATSQDDQAPDAQGDAGA